VVVSTPSEVEGSELGPNLTLGVKRDNRESVHGPEKVALTSNIGLEGWTLGLEIRRALSRDPKPAQAGQENVVDEGGWPDDQRQSTNDVLPRTNFDN
jgi:hypothetical protein